MKRSNLIDVLAAMLTTKLFDENGCLFFSPQNMINIDYSKTRKKTILEEGMRGKESEIGVRQSIATIVIRKQTTNVEDVLLLSFTDNKTTLNARIHVINDMQMIRTHDDDTETDRDIKALFQ